MAETNESIILEVKFDTGDAAQELSRINYQIATLKDTQKALKKEIDAGNDATGEMAKQYAQADREIKNLTATQKALTGQINATTDADHQLGDSFRELDAQMRDLENQYKSLTKAQRESAEGQKMRQQLIDLKQELKDFDAELGNHQRNVGNYPQTVQAVFSPLEKWQGIGERVTGMISGMTETAKNAPKALKEIAVGLGQATKAALKFIATPIGAILAAIVVAVKVLSAAFGKLQEAFQKNDTAGTQWAKLMSSFEPILDGITKMFDKLALAIGYVAEKIADFIAKFSDAAKAAQELTVAQDNLEEAERNYTVNSAKRNKELSELRSKAADKEKYTVSERRKFLKEAIELQKQNLEDEKAIAAEKLRLLEETAKKESDTSDDTATKIAQARAAMYQAEQKYFNGVKDLQQQLNSFNQEERAAQEKNRAEQAAKQKAELEKNEKSIKEAADKLAAIREELVKRTRKAVENEIAELEKRRDKELEIAGLTADERLAIENYYSDEIKKLREADVKLQKETEEAKVKAREDARIAAGLDPEKTPEELELEKLQQLREQDLLNVEEYEEAKAKIEKKFADEKAEKEKEAVETQKEQYRDSLKSAVATASGAANALASVFGEYAEQSKAAAIAQKAFGLVGILTNQAQSISEGALAIAKGVESAAGIPFPANIPAIISITAQIGGMLAGVATSISQAKQLFAQANDAGNFEQGGTIKGTSYTGDKLIAHVNSGEGIYTMRQANNVLQEIANNPLRGGTEAMTEALVSALSAMPAPTMVYEEFETFKGNVATYNELSKI